MWAATQHAKFDALPISISIHAARVGSDQSINDELQPPYNFNPRCPCGQRPSLPSKLPSPHGFQSTLPVWAATLPYKIILSVLFYFNPRCPCGQRRLLFQQLCRLPLNFNPRCPCGQRPFGLYSHGRRCLHFNPRCPCGQRLPVCVFACQHCDFNPRCPCGQRLWR